MFCNVKECDNKCPAYVYNNNPGLTCCALMNAQIEADKAKKAAYDTMRTELLKVK